MTDAPSQLERMLAGEFYLSSDPVLVEMRRRARELTRRFNATREDQPDERLALLRSLFGTLGERCEVEPTFRCDYGFHIHAGDGLYMNFDCVILDVCEVRIGYSCFFGPGVHVYTATHPLDAALRSSGAEMGKPVRIGDRVWIGGRAVILPGVSVGDEAVIGAGSVVTRDVPPRTLVAGNPARVVRTIG